MFSRPMRSRLDRSCSLVVVECGHCARPLGGGLVGCGWSVGWVLRWTGGTRSAGRVDAQGEDARQDEGAHQRPGVRRVGQVGVRRRVRAVGHHDAHGPLGRPRGLLGLEPAGEERCGQVAGDQQDPVEAGEGQVGQDHPGLVLQQVGQRLVRSAASGPTRPCRPPARPRGRPPRPWRRPGRRTAGPPRSRRRRPRMPSLPRGRSGRRWPGTGRRRGRCRRPWSWRCPGGPGSAARRRRCGPGSRSGRRRRGGGRRCPAPRSGRRCSTASGRAAVAPTDETVWRFLSHCQPIRHAGPAVRPVDPQGQPSRLSSVEVARGDRRDEQGQDGQHGHTPPDGERPAPWSGPAGRRRSRRAGRARPPVTRPPRWARQSMLPREADGEVEHQQPDDRRHREAAAQADHDVGAHHAHDGARGADAELVVRAEEVRADAAARARRAGRGRGSAPCPGAPRPPGRR